MPSNKCADAGALAAVVFIVGLFYAPLGCSKKEGTAETNPPTVEVRCAAIAARIDAMNTYWRQCSGYLIFNGTGLAAELEKLIAEGVERIERVRPFAEKTMPVADQKLAEEFTAGMESWVLDRERRLRDFESRHLRRLKEVRDAFIDLKSIGETITLLSQNGVACADPHSRLTALTATHEDARRWWLDQLTRIVTQKPIEETAFEAGLANIVKVGEEAAPLRERLTAAKAEWIRLKNHLDGITSRLAWAERTVLALPADEPFRKTPEADIGAQRASFAPIAERARELQKTCLDRSRDHEKAVAQSELDLAAFMSRFLAPVVERARAHGLALPEG